MDFKSIKKLRTTQTSARYMKKKLYKIDIAGSLRQLSTGESVEFTMNEVKPQTVRNIASREGRFRVNEIGIIIKVTRL